MANPTTPTTTPTAAFAPTLSPESCFGSAVEAEEQWILPCAVAFTFVAVEILCVMESQLSGLLDSTLK